MERKINSVLTTVSYSLKNFEALRQIFQPAEIVRLDQDDEAGIAEALERADVAVLSSDLDQRFLDAPRLEWIHCDHAGLNASAVPELFKRTDLIVTGSAGRNAAALAQHAMFFALSLAYEAPRLIDTQRQRKWNSLADYEDGLCLWGKTIGVVGYGNTGRELARLAKAFGMRVLVYGRHPDDADSTIVDEYLDAGEAGSLDRLLAASDFVVLTIRLTDDTYHLIGEHELATMKRSAYLINLARGPVVDEPVLAAALAAGEIRGAGLDVFEQEPLPPDAVIWDAPHTIFTSHTTLRLPDATERSLRTIEENRRRFLAGEPMLNALTPDDVFSH
ncbi:MAG: D-isomer specific 2-hydroxyacid dehydrogenase, NAD-binding protein [Rhodoglobus sp.]|nr:D-isomer specific 2-hydroxyacid dehydrogenase, NAD-binding protein [Rhodoglobus sp.]